MIYLRIKSLLLIQGVGYDHSYVNKQHPPSAPNARNIFFNFVQSATATQNKMIINTSSVKYNIVRKELSREMCTYVVVATVLTQEVILVFKSHDMYVQNKMLPYGFYKPRHTRT